MFDLVSAIPDADTILALPAEELGGRLIFILQARQTRERSPTGHFHVGNLLNEFNHASNAPPYGAKTEEVAEAVSEALTWLQGQALIVPWTKTSSPGWMVLSRRGRQMKDSRDFATFRQATLLPRELVHASIIDAAWLSFVRGEYDTAAFQAMRQVEIAVRAASGLKDETTGVRLARKAFHPEGGPLTDLEAEPGERQGMADLFAGALGALKNPHSHRVVDLEGPAEAARVVLLASQLLTIVERRATHAP